MTTYQTRRQQEYKGGGEIALRRGPRRKEPTSGMKPLEFSHKPTREWIDTPEDRAAVAAILKGGAK